MLLSNFSSCKYQSFHIGLCSFSQNCLVLINTLMIQEVLLDKNKSLLQKLVPEDFRALTPLIYAHVNPYGTFKLNMKERLTLQRSS